jgi:hypothetical protein
VPNKRLASEASVLLILRTKNFDNQNFKYNRNHLDYKYIRTVIHPWFLLFRSVAQLRSKMLVYQVILRPVQLSEKNIINLNSYFFLPLISFFPACPHFSPSYVLALFHCSHLSFLSPSYLSYFIIFLLTAFNLSDILSFLLSSIFFSFAILLPSSLHTSTLDYDT